MYAKLVNTIIELSLELWRRRSLVRSMFWNTYNIKKSVYKRIQSCFPCGVFQSESIYSFHLQSRIVITFGTWQSFIASSICIFKSSIINMPCRVMISSPRTTVQTKSRQYSLTSGLKLNGIINYIKIFIVFSKQTFALMTNFCNMIYSSI